MFGKRRLRAEIMRLAFRVADLEERLCPCEGHDWKKIDSGFFFDGHAEGEMWYRYKCRTCGKVVQTIQPFLEGVKAVTSENDGPAE